MLMVAFSLYSVPEVDTLFSPLLVLLVVVVLLLLLLSSDEFAFVPCCTTCVGGGCKTGSDFRVAPAAAALVLLFAVV